jgi:glycosyltransferase involved in cell wall biosynthesis
VSISRILFVTHSPIENCYGASTSLRLLLENYSSSEADLVVPRSIRRRRDLTSLARQFPAVRNVYELSVPVDFGAIGIKLGLAGQAHRALHRAYWQWDRVRFRELIRRNHYDLIHFNSPVLHEMIEPGMPAITHIRDILRGRSSHVIDKLAAGAGLVFIDVATRHPFESALDRTPSIVLNNPIEMSGISDHSGISHPRLTPSTTVYSVIGRVFDYKGVDFVIEAFREGAAEDSLLLVVGSGGDAKYDARCRSAAGNDPRVVFWGEDEDVKKIYASTHYVVRGDPQGCIGRTVYEGLYSGCHVIMPGLGEPDFLFEADRFRDRIHLYRSRDVRSLSAVFKSCQPLTGTSRVGLSNVADYVREFTAFLTQCVEDGVDARPIKPGAEAPDHQVSALQ